MGRQPTVFEHWAGELKKRGIASVRNVIIDDSVFDQTFVHPNWPADQEHKRYVAQVGGVNLNINCVDFNVRTTSVGQVVQYTINPETKYITVRKRVLLRAECDLAFAATGDERHHSSRRGRRGHARLRDDPRSADVRGDGAVGDAGTQRRQGDGHVQRDRTTRDALRESKRTTRNRRGRFVAVHETPLAVVMARANKDSMNLYAERCASGSVTKHRTRPDPGRTGPAAFARFSRRRRACRASSSSSTTAAACRR
jgi:D-alanyl-D-alanine carboxypeptidase